MRSSSAQVDLWLYLARSAFVALSSPSSLSIFIRPTIIIGGTYRIGRQCVGHDGADDSFGGENAIRPGGYEGLSARKMRDVG